MNIYNMRILSFLIRASIFCMLVLIAEDGIAGDPVNILKKIGSSKTRIMIVSSYHREFLWSQGTNKGICSALYKFGYLDNQNQELQFTQTDFVETSTTMIQKLWMDTKRKNSLSEIAESLAGVVKIIDTFKPDILLLGDDNAVNYVGNYYLDTKLSVVFWGINGLPIKYGLLESVQKPGHNITGVYQRGYLVEGFKELKKLIPTIQKIAILSDDSTTGRSIAKRINNYAEEGKLEAEVVELVITNSFEKWKSKALELEGMVDAFFISTHNTLIDRKGEHVDYLKAASWYLNNIRKPEFTAARFLVIEGFLSTVDDSAFKQGYEAVRIANKILSHNADPSEMSAYFPPKGPFIINRKRAEMLGLEKEIQENKNIIDEYVETISAFDKYPPHK